MYSCICWVNRREQTQTSLIKSAQQCKEPNEGTTLENVLWVRESGDESGSMLNVTRKRCDCELMTPAGQYSGRDRMTNKVAELDAHMCM